MKTPSTWVRTKSKFCSLDLERPPPPVTSTFAPGDHFHFFVGEDEGEPFLLCNFDVLGLPMLLCNLWLSAFEKWFVLTFIQNWIYEISCLCFCLILILWEREDRFLWREMRPMGILCKEQQYFVIFSYTTTITYLLCTNKVLNVPRKRGRMISKVRRLLWCPWALCLLLWYLHFPFLPNQTYEYRNHCRWWRFDEFF